jgi:hypothetical protein
LILGNKEKRFCDCDSPRKQKKKRKEKRKGEEKDCVMYMSIGWGESQY